MWMLHTITKHNMDLSLNMTLLGGFPAVACQVCIVCQTRRFSNHVSRLLSRSHTFAIIVILDLKIHQSMWIHWPFFPKTWTKGHWPLDDLWPHVCWGHMCDSTQGSLCPSPMTIHQCGYSDQFCKIPHTYILHTTYRMWSHSLLLNSVQARQKIGLYKSENTKQFVRSMAHIDFEWFI